MRIYSGFKDFYDPALRDFNDPTPIYKRETDTISLSGRISVDHVHRTRFFYPDEKRLLDVIDSKFSWSGVSGNDEQFKKSSFELSLLVLGFCGKLYPFYSNIYTKHENYRFGEPTISVYRKSIPDQFVWTSHVPILSGLGQTKNVVETVDGFDGLENSSTLKSIFVNHSVPAFVWLSRKPASGIDLILNPKLSEFDFHKIISPWEAMQELNMFMCNDLVKNNTPPMPVGNDKVISESKGFDKWSFRKMPTKNKL